MILYNGKSSFTDFDLYVASKDVPPAQLKEITESVPFMNGVWDFSFCNDEQGEYEPVILKYTFDVIEDTKKDLNALKKSINKWLHSRGEQKLYDTDISTTEYYKVYNVKAGWSEEGLQGLVTVEFKCYPFMLFEKSTGAIELTTDPKTLTIENEGGRIVAPTIEIASKNLFNAQSCKIYNASGENPTLGNITVNNNEIVLTKLSNLAFLCGHYLDVEAGEPYTLSYGGGKNQSGEAYAILIYNDKPYGNRLTSLNTDTWAKKTFVPQTSKIFVGLYSSVGTATDENLTYSNVQLERGSIATEYTPYIDANATIIDGVNSYALSAGKHTNVLRLKTGANTFNVSGAGLITVAYTEESI